MRGDLASAGYPTFAIDEIGTAETSPIVPSSDVTLTTVAYVAHEAVQDLLGGEIDGIHFGDVIEVGHSRGSYTAWAEAGTYHDVAGLVITGAAHDTTTFSENGLSTDLHPAIDDLRFAGSDLDSGYLTTEPGTRGTLFYSTTDSDPTVIARDEATKDVISGTLVSSDLGLSTVTKQITAPVLVILGGRDNLFCGPETDGARFSCASGQDVATEEAPYYATQARLRACVVPGSGHDINLALNHVVEEADALSWSEEYVGQHGAPLALTHVLPPHCST